MRHHRSHVTCAGRSHANLRREEPCNLRRHLAQLQTPAPPFGEVTAGRQVLTGPKYGRAPG